MAKCLQSVNFYHHGAVIVLWTASWFKYTTVLTCVGSSCVLETLPGL